MLELDEPKAERPAEPERPETPVERKVRATTERQAFRLPVSTLFRLNRPPAGDGKCPTGAPAPDAGVGVR